MSGGNEPRSAVEFREWIRENSETGEEAWLRYHTILTAYRAGWRNSPEDFATVVMMTAMYSFREEYRTLYRKPAQYIYGVAKHVACRPPDAPLTCPLEIERLPAPGAFWHRPERATSGESRAVSKCLKMFEEDGQFLLEYYRSDAEERQRMADALGISIEALRVRKRRALDQIEKCVESHRT